MAADLYGFERLHRAYRACRRTKRATYNALAFEVDAEAKLLALQEELRERSYRPGRSVCFVTTGPKPREVFAADFRDRIVHHLLVAALERVFEPRFIHDSYACRPGKGTLAASDRLMQFLRQVTANGHRPGWALKLDVASFFASIHKEMLYALITRRVRDPELCWLTRTILFHDPTEDYRFRALGGRVPSPGSAGYPVAPAKSLFGSANERGLPIGNLTSQFWANVYLDALDQHVKRALCCRWYVRYVDDMILLADDAEQLRAWHAGIATFLAERLRLALRAEPAEPRPVRHGVTFVGWRTWWSHRVPRRQTLGSLRRRVAVLARCMTEPALAGAALAIDLRRRTRAPAPRAGAPARPLVQQLQATLAAYAGHLRHGAAYRQWHALWARSPWLGLVFRRTGWCVAVRWRWPAFARDVARRERGHATAMSQTYRAVLRAAGGEVLVFFRVGRYFELYGPQRVLAERVLGLRAIALPRAGFAFTAGFPTGCLRHFVARAVARGFPVALVVERRVAGLLRRAPTVVWTPRTKLELATRAGAVVRFRGRGPAMSIAKPLITTSPDRLSGTPVFAGTRVPVQTLIDYLEGGDSLEAFLVDFPSVSREHAIAVLELAKSVLLANAVAA